jgi:biopolymer transport protein ExbD
VKSPSNRRRGGTRSQVTLNLVPIIDTMVTLIAFMLFTTSFFVITSIETPFPQASADRTQQELKEKPVQLTLSIRPTESEIWSPFDRVERKVIPNPLPGQPDIKAVHEALLQVKHQYPYEDKVIIVPYSGVTYDTLITTMDAMRMMDPTDPPQFRKSQTTGIDEPVKQLFPNVIFGNLLGDT